MIQPKKVFILIILVLFGSNLFSQYYVKTKGDSTAFGIDSLILVIDDLEGTIDWEASTDTLTWRSLNHDNDTIIVRIDSAAYYRARLSVESCDPASSEVALVSYKAVYASGNYVTIDPSGCVYEFPSGLKIIAPPGAVEKEVSVSMELLDSIGADLKMPLIPTVGKVFSAALYCESTDAEFLKPIKIRVPVNNYECFDVPFVYTYDPSTLSWILNTEPLICSPNQQYLEFSTDILHPVRVELSKNVFGYDKPSSEKKQEIDCHELLVRIQVEMNDLMGKRASGECYVISEEIKVEFIQCLGENVDIVEAREIGEDCIPQISAGLDKPCLSKGESATLSFKAWIGPLDGLPLENQTIIISMPDGLTVTDAPPHKTDEKGVASVGVKCIADNINGSIEYIMMTEYYLLEQSASSEGLNEHVSSFHQNEPVKGSPLAVAVCPEKPDVAAIELGQPSRFNLSAGDRTQIEITCRDIGGNVVSGLSDLTIEWVVENYPYNNGGVISITEDNNIYYIDALKPGYVKIKARAHNTRTNAHFESNFVGYSVSYKGRITMNKASFVGPCYCPYDLEEEDLYNFWSLSYDGTMEMEFWLHYDDTRYAFAKINKGCEWISYTIDSDRCRSETIENEIFTMDEFESNLTTNEIANGGSFHIDFEYYQWPSVACTRVGSSVLLKGMTVSGILTSPNSVGINGIYSLPDGCLGSVYNGTGVLQ